MQRVMQSDAAVFRTAESLNEGKRKLAEVVASFAGKRSKELAGIHQRLARAYLAEGDKGRALTELDQAFKIDPGSVAVLRDIPGLVVAVPARAEDAGPLLRTCLAAAVVDGTVSVFLEPIALYHTRDLHSDGDGQWLGEYLPPSRWVRMPPARIGARASIRASGKSRG